MKWAWRIARIRDVDVNLHVTFIMFLAWVAVSSRAGGASAASTLSTLLFTLAVFGSVLLHEFGHVTMARRFGVPTRRVTLLPIGGVAELERMPERPREELLVTLAGPLVNVAIGFVLFGVLRATSQPVLVAPDGLFGQGHHLARLFWVNVSLVVFNAIPAFPMDGGRILRALLSMRLGRVRATRIASSVGQAIALAFAFFGLFGNALLLFIGLFVWIGAQSELEAAETRAALTGVPIGAAIERDLRTLGEHDRLGLAASQLLSGAQRDFPVADDRGALVGVLTRAQLIAGLKTAGADGVVRDAMTRGVLSIETTADLAEAIERMRERHVPIVAIKDGAAVVGVLTEENATELVLVRRALAAHAAGHPADKADRL